MLGRQSSEGCTTAVISGRVTVDGRPILWKNRDTSNQHNNVVLLTDGKYKSLVIVNAGSTRSVWMGVNEAGFCIENSLSLDLADPKNSKGPANGALMKRAIQECATVAEFQYLLEETNESGRSTVANFGVIDAHGGAAMFETGPRSFKMFDANDPQVAPQGYVVRSNFATTARELPAVPTVDAVQQIDSGQRFLRACRLLEPAVADGVSVEYVLQNMARDLSDNNGEPFPGTVNAIGDTLPAVIPTANTISRTTTVSAAVFHGVKPGEDPRLTTMWAIMGDPKFSIAVPCFVATSEIADALEDARGSELGEIALTLRDWALDSERKGIITKGLPGTWSDLWKLEDEILNETLELKDQFSESGIFEEQLTSLHLRNANRAMMAMQKELVEAKEMALRGFDAAETTNNIIRVAIYDHSTGTANGPKNLMRILTPDAGYESVRLTPAEIRDGKLAEFDVLIMPGGSGSKQAAMLKEAGRSVIRDFVSKGGGYVGICAGSYLASSHYDWSLDIINARVWDRAHWARGTGAVTLGVSDNGKALFSSELNEVDVYYGQGPLLIPGSNSDLEPYEVLAVYETEIASKGAPKNSMTGTHAIVRAKFGEGKVICYSPHPESSDGPNWMIEKGVRWAAGNSPR